MIESQFTSHWVVGGLKYMQQVLIDVDTWIYLIHQMSLCKAVLIFKGVYLSASCRGIRDWGVKVIGSLPSSEMMSRIHSGVGNPVPRSRNHQDFMGTRGECRVVRVCSPRNDGLPRECWFLWIPKSIRKQWRLHLLDYGPWYKLYAIYWSTLKQVIVHQSHLGV